MGDMLNESCSKRVFTEDDDVIETLSPDSAKKPVHYGIAVGTAGRNPHAIGATGLEKRAPRLCEERIPTVDEVGRVAKESVDGVGQVAGDLEQPGSIRLDPNAGYVDFARAQFDHEEAHDADGTKHAEGLDGEEVASVERVPVSAEELFPGALSVSLWSWFEAGSLQDVCHRTAGDVDLESAQRIPEFGVTPSRILGSELEDEFAHAGGFPRSAWLPWHARAVVLGSREFAKPLENR